MVGATGSVGRTCVAVPVGASVGLAELVSVGAGGVSVEASVFCDWELGSVAGTAVLVGGGAVVGASVGVGEGMEVFVGAGVTGVCVGTAVWVNVAVAGELQISLMVISGGGRPAPQDQPSTTPSVTWKVLEPAGE